MMRTDSGTKRRTGTESETIKKGRTGRKKAAAGICVLALSGMLAACGNQAGTVQPGEGTETSENMAADTGNNGNVPEEAKGSGSEPEEAGNTGSIPAEKEKTGLEDLAARESGYISGTISAMSSDSLSLETEDGETMEFGMREVVLDTEADLTEGLFVTVNYEEKEDTRTALYLTDAPLVTGEVVDGTMGSVRIRLEDGTEMNFDKQEASVNLEEGLLIGNQITVAYRSVGDSQESGFYRALWIRDAKEGS